METGKSITKETGAQPLNDVKEREQQLPHTQEELTGREALRERPLQEMPRQEMRSLGNFLTRKQTMGEGYEWLFEQRIPKQEANAQISRFYMDAYGKKLGRIERHKIRKRIEKDRGKYRERTAVVEGFFRQANEWDQDFQDPKYTNLRNPWSYLGMLENREDRIELMNGFADGNSAQIRSSCRKLFDRFEALDMNRFTYRNKDELYARYQENMKAVRAGMNLRWAITAYRQNGGFLDHEEYLRLMAIADMMETLQKLYEGLEIVHGNPASFLVTEETLNAMTVEQLRQKEMEMAERAMSFPKESPEHRRLKQLSAFYQKAHMAAEFRQSEQVPGKDEYLTEGRSGAECFESILRQRRKQEADGWAESRKKYLEEKQSIDDLVGPKGFLADQEKKPKFDGDHLWSGVKDGETLPDTTIELYYMMSRDKTLDVIAYESTEEEFVEEYRSAERSIIRRCESGREIPTWGGTLMDMCHGFLAQFQYWEKFPRYQQFNGLDPGNPGFGKCLALHEHFVRLAKDIQRAAEANEEAADFCMKYLAEDKKLLKRVFAYLDRFETLAAPTLLMMNSGDEESFRKTVSGVKDGQNDNEVDAFNGQYLFFTSMTASESVNAGPSGDKKQWILPMASEEAKEYYRMHKASLGETDMTAFFSEEWMQELNTDEIRFGKKTYRIEG